MNIQRYFVLVVFLSALLLLLRGQAVCASAAEKPDDIRNRRGMAVVGGDTYDLRKSIRFVQVSGFVLFDHDKIFPHRAPEALRFKIEGSLGSTTYPEKRLIMSAGIFSLYYINALATKIFKPYVEGGISGVYIDYLWKGHGTRFNFNPQLGIGTEINTSSGQPFIVALRLYHISNAHLNIDNRGLNAVTLHIGRFF